MLLMDAKGVQGQGMRRKGNGGRGDGLRRPHLLAQQEPRAVLSLRPAMALDSLATWRGVACDGLASSHGGMRGDGL